MNNLKTTKQNELVIRNRKRSIEKVEFCVQVLSVYVFIFNINIIFICSKLDII